MADIIYTPRYQPPAWRDNVDFVAAEGPVGFNAQFQNLQAELATLSGIVKQLNAAILNTNRTLQTAGSAIQQLQTLTNVVQAACWGEIKSDGTIFSGSGNFTIAKASTGVYDVVFTSAFTAIPTVVATLVWQPLGTDPIPVVAGGDTRENEVVIGVTPGRCRIKTGNSSGTASDRSFSFLVYGPTK